MEIILILRAVINRIVWDPHMDSSDYFIVILHRGGLENKKTIPFSNIKKVYSSWFALGNENGEEMIIPFHRVIEIRHRSGAIIWKRNLHGGTSV
jgi:uncharacterized protein (UPF0248 family)